MTTINLLPWREQRRELRKRQFLGMWGGVTVWLLFVVLLAHLLVSSWIDHQQAHNRILTVEIAALDKKIEEIKNLKKVRADLIARMRIIQDLQANRPHIVKLFDQFVRMLPKGIYLQQVVRETNLLNLIGYAESNTNISDFMRTIEASTLFEQPKLTAIKEMLVGKKTLSQFNLVFQFKELTEAPKDVPKEPLKEPKKETTPAPTHKKQGQKSA